MEDVTRALAYRPLAPRLTRHSVLPESLAEPTPRVNRQRRHRHPNKEWDDKKHEIARLYINERNTIEEVLFILERDFQFKASRRRLFQKLNEWGIEKNKKRQKAGPEPIPMLQNKAFISSLRSPNDTSAFEPPVLQSPHRPFSHHNISSLEVSALDFCGLQSDDGILLMEIDDFEVASPTAPTSPPTAPFIPWPESILWASFQQNLWIPTFDAVIRQFCCSNCSLIMKYVKSPIFLLDPTSSTPNPSFQDKCTEVYSILIRLMPETYEHQHLARVQAISRQLGEVIFVTSILELLLFFASNNLSINDNGEMMDEAVIGATEYLLVMKAPFGELARSSEPTAQALAGRIFASSVRSCRLGTLRKLSKAGFQMRLWAGRQIPCNYALRKLRPLNFGRQSAPGSVLPIHLALINSHVELAEFLIQNGADINQTTNVNYEYDISSIHAAAASNGLSSWRKSETIKFVLQHPDSCVTENQIFDTLSILHSEIIDLHDSGMILLNHLLELNNARELMSPTWALKYAVQYDHWDLIYAVVSLWSQSNSICDPYQAFRWTDYPKPLWEAVCRGNSTLCELLLDIGIDPSLEDPSFPSALHLAAAVGNVEIVDLLIKYGAQINYNVGTRPKLCRVGYDLYTSFEGTPLSCAILWDNHNVVAFLLDSGAHCDVSHLKMAIECEIDFETIKRLFESTTDFTDQSESKESILALAIRHKNPLLINHLLHREPGIYDPLALVECVSLALKARDPSLLQQLLDLRSNYPGDLEQHIISESIALALSVFNGDQTTTKMLINHGFFLCSDFHAYAKDMPCHPLFSVNATWVENNDGDYIIRDGCSLLGVAVLGRYEDMFDFLVECGHEPRASDLSCALYAHDELAIIKLMSCPGFMDQTLNDWPECLPLAIEASITSLVDLMLDIRIDVNAFSKRTRSYRGFIPSQTALQAACAKGDMGCINLLIELGADVNSPASRHGGATALQLAVMNGFIGIVKALIEKGADVNAPGAVHNGRTALEAAGECGHIDIIQHLLLMGAATDGPNQLQYLRAIMLAKAEGHLVAADLLKRHRSWTQDDDKAFANIAFPQHPMAQFDDIDDTCSVWEDEESKVNSFGITAASDGPSGISEMIVDNRYYLEEDSQQNEDIYSAD